MMAIKTKKQKSQKRARRKNVAKMLTKKNVMTVARKLRAVVI